VDDDAMEVVRQFGRAFHRTGVTFYFLGRRDLPEELRRQDRYAKLEGTTLLVGSDGVLITAYRNRVACRVIKKKPKYRLAMVQETKTPRTFPFQGNLWARLNPIPLPTTNSIPNRFRVA
jgi:hypothetical protein